MKITSTTVNDESGTDISNAELLISLMLNREMEKLIEELMTSSTITPYDITYEVSPGQNFLTLALASKCHKMLIVYCEKHAGNMERQTISADVTREIIKNMYSLNDEDYSPYKVMNDVIGKIYNEESLNMIMTGLGQDYINEWLI